MLEKIAEVAEKAGEMVVEASKKAAEKVADESSGISEHINEHAGEADEHIKDSEGKVLLPDLDAIEHRSLESIKIENSGRFYPWRIVKDTVESPEAEGTPNLNEMTEVNEKVGLTNEEKVLIKNETGWSDEIIDHIESMEQYEIYKKAGLHEAEIDGRKCLVKDIDLDYVDSKTGMTNRELMEKGRTPIDSKTGEKIELHHMGQDYDGPFVELCENSEHGDGNHSVLHTKMEDSWRSNPEMENHYNNVDRPNHWKERAKGA